MALKTKFIVTKKAGAFVAGMRSPGEGGTLSLTEDQAKYALITGELERPNAEPAKKPKAPAKTETEGDKG